MWAVTSESSAAIPGFPVVMNVAFEDIQAFQGHQRLISNLADPQISGF